MRLASRHRLTVYDAAYLELARRRDVPLAALDTDLRKAALAEGVPLLGLKPDGLGKRTKGPETRPAAPGSVH